MFWEVQTWYFEKKIFISVLVSTSETADKYFASLPNPQFWCWGLNLDFQKLRKRSATELWLQPARCTLCTFHIIWCTSLHSLMCIPVCTCMAGRRVYWSQETASREVGSFLPPQRFQRSNSSLQMWWQALSLTESSRWPFKCTVHLILIHSGEDNPDTFISARLSVYKKIHLQLSRKMNNTDISGH